MTPENNWWNVKYENNSYNKKENNNSFTEKNFHDKKWKLAGRVYIKENSSLENISNIESEKDDESGIFTWDEQTPEKRTQFYEQHPNIDNKVHDLQERWDVEHEKIISEQRKKIFELKNDIHKTVPNVNWITIREKKAFTAKGKAKFNGSKKLNDVVYSWQRLSVQEKWWERKNVLWDTDKNWEPNFVYQWTKEPVVINNWTQILPINESTLYKAENIKNKNDWFKIGEVKSEKATYIRKKNWKNQSYCSRTAKNNIEKLLRKLNISKPVKQWDARDAFNQYRGTPKESFPPKNPKAKIVDLYLDASAANARYWHRSVWVKINWAWYVLDPYYLNRSTAPIPANKYMSHMTWTLKKRFWWGYVIA